MDSRIRTKGKRIIQLLVHIEEVVEPNNYNKLTHKIMEEAFYTLQVRRTDEGISFVEDGNMQEFELMGVLTHVIQQHSFELDKQMKEYAKSSNN